MSHALTSSLCSGVLAEVPTWALAWTPQIVIAAFFFAFGACVGSFLNVVVYRLPAGQSIVRPSSRCPKCGWVLSWWENLPIISWLILRGRCRRCREKISIQYLLVELFVAILFSGTYLLLFMVPSSSWWSGVGGEWWTYSGLVGAWPAFLILITLLCGLLAATLIDAKTFLIPAPVTNLIALVAIVGWLIQGLMPGPEIVAELWPIPRVGWQATGAALGGALGVGIACLLLWGEVLPRSFLDYEEYVPEGETLGEYPHARREMWKELLFLLPAMAGLVAGWFFLAWMGPEVDIPRWLGAVAGSLLGWLLGGGLIWGVRILGTFAFGREAMGMGDVHLLAAVGAALGWIDPMRAFFIAPFIALAWVAISRLLTLFRRGAGRELPYGPHLAMATLVVIYLRPAVESLQAALLAPTAMN